MRYINFQEHVMDERTRLLIYKLVNIGLLESVTGSISAGKESIVFHAFGGRYALTSEKKITKLHIFHNSTGIKNEF